MTQEEQKVSGKTLFWNRVQLLAILVVFAAPIIGAFLYQPSEFNNYGDIYRPARPVENLSLQTSDGQMEMDSLRRQWVFLVVANGECDEDCENNILKMRQLRFMQNNDMVRIRTLFVHTNMNAGIVSDLAAKYRPIEVGAADAAELREWSKVLKLENAPKAAEKDRFYIIDPAGNLMMSYPPTADPNLMKKDIKRLLKASQIG